MEQNNNKEIASCVKAAVRVRPLSSSEKQDLCQTCVEVQRSTNEIILANSTAFTFDYVFLPEANQDDLYKECVHDMIEGCFQGYSASILAYGQTGSGKTFTMGSGIEYMDPTKEGIIPRAIIHIFQRCASYERQAEEQNISLAKCVVSCQFIEIYNEQIFDLFNKENIDCRTQKHVDKHVVFENTNGEITVSNITTRFVTSANETLECLKEGALSRTTAATRMNNVSSRSHAIFTVTLQFDRAVQSTNSTATSSDIREHIRAKIHFVDLAGSESLKRTGATGLRAKEGISINSGLLVLGNVISILGDPLKKAAHVPYRDSKLTRLLQDSLGGNSRTLMIACISPVDRDFSETKSTLNYAQRARNIRNRVKVNQDKHSRQVVQLQMEIERLRAIVEKYERPASEFDSASNSVLSIELDRIRSYVYTIQRTIEETNTASLTLKEDLELIRNHRQHDQQPQKDTLEDKCTLLGEQCMEIVNHGQQIHTEEIQCRLSRMIDVSNVLQRKSPIANRRRSRLSTRSFSCDQSIATDYQTPNDELQPCIEDIRLQIDRLRQEQQLIRESGSAKKGLCSSTIPGSPQSPSETHVQPIRYPLYTNSSEPQLELMPIEEHEPTPGSDDEDEQNDQENENENVQISDQQEQNAQEEKLVLITTEINQKQRCLEALENARKRSDVVRLRYEEKIKLLQERISHAEEDKQSAVTKFTSCSRDTQNLEELKLARRDYEDKIRRLEIENNELSALRAQYAVCIKDGDYYKRELAKHNNEMKDLRKMKVQLTRELRQEFNRHRQAEQARAREIATLKRTQVQKENEIRTLRAAHKQKEIILKRKQEEVHLLRRQMRTARMRKTTNEMAAHFSSIHQGVRIANAIRRRKLIAGVNRDMKSLIENRERISRKRERYLQRLSSAIVTNNDQKSDDQACKLREKITKLESNITYLNSQIASCQQCLMAYDEEDTTELQGPDPQLIVDCVTDTDELRYLLTKMIEQTIEKGFEAEEANEMKDELQTEVNQFERTIRLQQEMITALPTSANATTIISSATTPNSLSSTSTAKRQKTYHSSAKTKRKKSSDNNIEDDCESIDEIILQPHWEDNESTDDETEIGEDADDSDDDDRPRGILQPIPAVDSQQPKQQPLLNSTPVNNHKQQLLPINTYTVKKPNSNAVQI
ncbi:unnamed protein product [Didymodactylos carnosus]|uniref:Kinesin motor domain-containing protein n=1 Tax=Didymodactylos carnosus TaxID=1234261 RepID=A0A8S2GTF5_9BILA|nr:unnamed protein product [Didymodactylos carnosus]CAF3558352.1 unnamed protein product [Didymodactylos carnosus]